MQELTTSAFVEVVVHHQAKERQLGVVTKVRNHEEPYRRVFREDRPLKTSSTELEVSRTCKSSNEIIPRST
jgi:hypothetical protein